MAKRHTVFSLGARGCFLILCLGVNIFGTLPVHAQNDRHYNTIQYGLRGIIMNGAMVAGVHDNSSLYYNPAALSLANSEGFDISLFAISAEYVKYKNAYGEGNNSKESGIHIIPGLVTFNKSPFKNENISLAGGLFTRANYNNNREGEFVTETEAGILYNDVRISHSSRELWLAGGVSYRFDNNIAIGFCQYFSIGSNGYEHELNYNIFDKEVPGNLLFEESDRLNFNQNSTLGMINRLGLAWSNDKIKIGVTVTTPTYAHIMRNTKVRYDYAYITEDSSYSNKAIYDVKGEHKTPFSATAGLEFSKNKVLVAMAVEYFHQVGAYNLAAPKDSDNLQSINGDRPLNVRDSRKRIFNINLGYEVIIRDYLALLGGFRTNFNFNNQPSDFETLRLHQSYFDLYHITNGFKVSKGQNQFTVGVDYGFSFNDGLPVIADLESNRISRTGQNNASVAYNNVTFLITYTFLLDKIKNMVEE